MEMGMGKGKGEGGGTIGGSPAVCTVACNDWVTATWVDMKNKVAPGVEPASV